MIDQWYLIFFNLLFSSLPQLVTGVLDKDVPADVLLTAPQLYKSGQNMEVRLPSCSQLLFLGPPTLHIRLTESASVHTSLYMDTLREIVKILENDQEGAKKWILST